MDIFDYQQRLAKLTPELEVQFKARDIALQGKQVNLIGQLVTVIVEHCRNFQKIIPLLWVKFGKTI